MTTLKKLQPLAAGELVWLNQATAAIERVASIGEAKVLADRAGAIKVYAAKAGWSKREKGRVAEIETRATVRMGELLREMEKAKPGPRRKIGSPMEPISAPKLSDLGVKRAGHGKE